MYRQPSISIILALTDNDVLFDQSKTSWKISNDLRRFKSLTNQSSVIMGRLTYESIGHPLGGRNNIVLSRNDNFRVKGAKVVNSLKTALDVCHPTRPIFIIGGRKLFDEGLDYASMIYLTRIHLNLDRGIKYRLNLSGFKQSENVSLIDDSNSINYSFNTYIRKVTTHQPE